MDVNGAYFSSLEYVILWMELLIVIICFLSPTTNPANLLAEYLLVYFLFAKEKIH